jgi:hypothetical protein
MSRVVKLAGASGAGGGAGAGLSTADVTKLVQDNTDWSLLKRYELTSNITDFTFPAADFDFDNNWSWKMVFPNNYKHAAGHMYWEFPQGSCSYYGRNISNGGITGNSATLVYCTTASHQAGANLNHVTEMNRDSNNHRWQLKFETGMGQGGGYWNNPTWGYATMEGGTPANILSNGMTLKNCGIGPSANANNYIYLYGSNTTKGAE